MLSLFYLLIFSSVPSEAKTLINRLDAIVNKDPIYHSDITDFRRLIGLRAKIDPFYTSNPISKDGSQASDISILNFLIDEKIICQKFPATDTEVEQEIQSIQTNLKIDRTALKEAIEREGYKFSEYFELMRVAVSKRTLIEKEIRAKAIVSDDEVKASYYAKTSQGKKKFQGTIHVLWYSQKKSDFKSQEIGKSFFEDLRKKNGQDWQDLGFLTFEEMAPFIQKNLTGINVGEISPVLDNGDSFVLIKIAGVKTDDDPEFDQQKEKLRAAMLQVEFQHQIDLWLDHQKTENYIKKAAVYGDTTTKKAS